MYQRTFVHAFPKNYAARIQERIARQSTPLPDGCIEWTGALDRYGYGKLKVTYSGTVSTMTAHRAAWIAHSAVPLEPGLVVDHLCWNRACVNVDHLEPVTNLENSIRCDPHGAPRGRPRLKPGEHSCGEHGRVDGYDTVRADGYTSWVCRICRRVYTERYRARLRAKK